MAFTSSFAEEAAAMQLASEWATANNPGYSLTICTDSQSLLKAIERRSPVTHHLRLLFNTRPGPKALLWVLGHKENHGKELADTETKAAATTTSNPPRPTSYAAARTLIRRTLLDLPPVNSGTKEVYVGFSWSKDCKAISILSDTVLVAHFRSGHTLKAYGNFINPSADPLCALWKNEPQTIEILLRPSSSLPPTLKGC